MKLNLNIANKFNTGGYERIEPSAQTDDRTNLRYAKGFFVSILFLLLFYLPINHYYLQVNYKVTLPNFSWSNYEIFYPSIIRNDEYLLLYEEIQNNDYQQWEELTGLNLRPEVIADGCFVYSYDSFNKSQIIIRTEHESRVVFNRGGNITELNGNNFVLNISEGDKVYFYTEKECIPYISISDFSELYFIKLE